MRAQYLESCIGHPQMLALASEALGPDIRSAAAPAAAASFSSAAQAASASFAAPADVLRGVSV